MNERQVSLVKNVEAGARKRVRDEDEVKERNVQLGVQLEWDDNAG